VVRAEVVTDLVRREEHERLVVRREVLSQAGAIGATRRVTPTSA